MIIASRDSLRSLEIFQTWSHCMKLLPSFPRFFSFLLRSDMFSLLFCAEICEDVRGRTGQVGQ